MRFVPRSFSGTKTWILQTSTQTTRSRVIVTDKAVQPGLPAVSLRGDVSVVPGGGDDAVVATGGGSVAAGREPAVSDMKKLEEGIVTDIVEV